MYANVYIYELWRLGINHFKYKLTLENPANFLVWTDQAIAYIRCWQMFYSTSSTLISTKFFHSPLLFFLQTVTTRPVVIIGLPMKSL